MRLLCTYSCRYKQAKVGLAVLLDNRNQAVALLPIVYSSMVPGNLPSQLEILSTGQTYYETGQIRLATYIAVCPELRLGAPQL